MAIKYSKTPTNFALAIQPNATSPGAFITKISTKLVGQSEPFVPGFGWSSKEVPCVIGCQVFALVDRDQFFFSEDGNPGDLNPLFYFYEDKPHLDLSGVPVKLANNPATDFIQFYSNFAGLTGLHAEDISVENQSVTFVGGGFSPASICGVVPSGEVLTWDNAFYGPGLGIMHSGGVILTNSATVEPLHLIITTTNLGNAGLGSGIQFGIMPDDLFNAVDFGGLPEPAETFIDNLCPWKGFNPGGYYFLCNEYQFIMFQQGNYFGGSFFWVASLFPILYTFANFGTGPTVGSGTFGTGSRNLGFRSLIGLYYSHTDAGEYYSGGVGTQGQNMDISIPGYSVGIEDNELPGIAFRDNLGNVFPFEAFVCTCPSDPNLDNGLSPSARINIIGIPYDCVCFSDFFPQDSLANISGVDNNPTNINNSICMISQTGDSRHSIGSMFFITLPLDQKGFISVPIPILNDVVLIGTCNVKAGKVNWESGNLFQTNSTQDGLGFTPGTTFINVTIKGMSFDTDFTGDLDPTFPNITILDEKIIQLNAGMSSSLFLPTGTVFGLFFTCFIVGIQ